MVVGCGPTLGHGPRFSPGDAVFGLAEGSLGSHTVAATATLALLPASVMGDGGCTAPTVFTTADAALRQLAGTTCKDRCITCSESVLIQSKLEKMQPRCQYVASRLLQVSCSTN